MLIECPKCGAEQAQDNDFCLVCGLPLRARCPHCGAAVEPNARRCPRCGNRLRDPVSFAELFDVPQALQGRYEIEKRLKRGGATAVYLARDRGLGRACVIKEFNPRRLADEFERDEAQRSLHAEAARWAQLRHPHLTRIQDMFVQGGLSYLVMDVVRGRSLRQLVADAATDLSPSHVVTWAVQICEALAAAHSQSPALIFGDLTPDHVLINADGQVKLIDFGLSAWFNPWQRGAPRYQGSPGYAAPEQRERWEADERSDLYALGGILYYLLTRQAPNQPPLRLSELPPALAAVVRRARQRDPDRRFASAAEMRAALLDAVPAAAPVSDQAGPRPARPVVRPTVRPTPFAAPAPSAQAAPTTWAALRQQLAEQAAADWLRTVRRFYGGQTTEWLRREAARLREEGATAMAEQVARALDEAEALIAQGEMQDTLGRQAAVARWLVGIGAVPADPGFIVEPARLAFGGLTRKIAKRAHLRIRNTGSGMLVGEVESRLPWLTVEEGRFACGPGEVADVRVLASGKRVPVEGERAPRALRIVTNRGDAWVAATASLIVPTLAIQPAALDFGQVVRGETASSELVIANQGGGLIAGEVKSAVPWLSVVPEQFRVGAEGTQTVRVRLRSDLVPRSMLEAAAALVVDSDAGQFKVPVRWRWAEPGAAITPQALEWGERARGLAEMTLTITNTGTATLEGRLIAHAPWLSVQPAAFACAPQGSTTILVRADLRELPPGRTALGEALTVESNAGRWSVPTSVFVLAPELVVKPLLLELGEIEWGDAASAILRIGNRGTAPLTAEVISLFPWLHSEPGTVTIAPGETARVEVEARSEEMLHGGDWQQVPGLRVQADGLAREVEITFTVYKPELVIAPEFLDFGVIPRQGVGQATLTISNPGTAPLGWALSYDALWLEAPVDRGVTAPGATTVVPLYAYGLALPAGQDDAVVVLTIESDAGEQTVRGAVAIARPQLWVDPPLVDLGMSVNYAPVEGALGVFNRGVGEMTATIRPTVPWLTVEPAEVRVGTGGLQLVTLRATPQRLREGKTRIAGAVEVSSDAGAEAVDVQIEVSLHGELIIDTPRLEWTLGDPPPSLVLRNAGHAPLSISLHPQATWLAVNHARLAIKPGRTARVDLHVDETTAPATWPIETEIVLEHGRGTAHVKVTVNRDDTEYG